MNGWQWVKEGFALFARDPLTWLAIVSMAALASAFAAVLGRLGAALVSLLVPGVMGGLMLGCRELEQGGRLKFDHLAAGFRTGGAGLVTVGGVYLVGTILIAQLMIMMGGEHLQKLFEAARAESPDPTQAAEALRAASGAILTGSALMMVLLAATWFAPALVVFRQVGPIESLRLSLLACAKNLPAMFVYMTVFTVSSQALATVLGIWGLLVMLPLFLPSGYTSYRDIFEPDYKPAPQPPDGAAGS